VSSFGGAPTGGYESLGSGSAEDRIRRVREQMAAAEDRAAKAETFKARMEALRATGVSRGKGAEVEVDSAGVVTDLVLTDELSDATLVRIREEILEAIDAARARAGELAEESVTEAFGDASGLKEQFQPRFGSPPAGGDDDDPAPRRRGGVIG
jgi:DNA-binding protein YbaB